jgi:Bacterial SCP ortholog
MPPSRRLDPDQLLAAIRAQEDVLRGADLEVPTAMDPDRRIVGLVAAGLRAGVDPDRSALRFAVRVLADRLAARHPGRSVEVRVPPFAAVQCIAGPRHTRGTPPNVVETDPATFIGLACGFVSWDAATADGRVRASGERSDLGAYLPLDLHEAHGEEP